MEIPIDHKPTAEDMRRLAGRQYYVWDGELYLWSYRLGSQVCFVCPFCVTRYRKDGAPYARAKPCLHQHGADGFDDDGFGHRSSHCTRLPDARSGYRLYCEPRWSVGSQPIEVGMDMDDRNERMDGYSRLFNC